MLYSAAIFDKTINLFRDIGTAALMKATRLYREQNFHLAYDCKNTRRDFIFFFAAFVTKHHERCDIKSLNVWNRFASDTWMRYRLILLFNIGC